MQPPYFLRRGEGNKAAALEAKCIGAHRFVDLSNRKYTILVSFPWTVFLDPLEIYYSSHPPLPHTPSKFGPLDPPGISNDPPWGGGWIFLEPPIGYISKSFNFQ